MWGTDPALADGFALTVIRSPWDYQDSADNSRRFFEWLEAIDRRTLLMNPRPWLRWSLDKHYLADLEACGVPVTPTRFIEPDRPFTPDGLLERLENEGPFVLKPCVSAAARDTFLIDSAAAAREPTGLNGEIRGSFEAWRAGRALMVQPFLEEVRREGEWSLIFLDGTYSHAVRKRPAEGGWLVQDELGGSVRWESPPEPVREAAARAVDALPRALERSGARVDHGPLYARVDLIPTGAGPRVGEIELVEPELFFCMRDPHDGPYRPALERWVAAVERRVGEKGA